MTLPDVFLTTALSTHVRQMVTSKTGRPVAPVGYRFIQASLSVSVRVCISKNSKSTAMPPLTRSRQHESRFRAFVGQVQAIAADLRLDFGSMCTVMTMMDLLMYQSFINESVSNDISTFEDRFGWGPLAPGELSEELSEDLQIDIQLENRTPKCKAKNGNICLTPVEKVLVVSELKLGVLPAVNDQLALIQ